MLLLFDNYDSFTYNIYQLLASLGAEVEVVCHKEYAIEGIQFHPESILTPDGEKIMRNFLQGLA